MIETVKFDDYDQGSWGQSNWYPTVNLRLAVPDVTSTAGPVLQQEWRCDQLSRHGHISGYSREWRNVDRVVVDKAELIGRNS